ncbi:MAG: hypothetical protein IH612_21250, partial [Desulfofustis sp.]|nr:hypothetical protein [Desulfofustis sp.]
MRIYSNHIVLSRHLFLGLALALIVACPPVSRGGETPDSSQGARGAETNVFRGGSLKLVGTVAARDPGQRVAIIKDEEKGRQWIYREGDYAGKILIKRILHDRIIVDAGGGKALLKMTRSPSTGFGPSPPRYRPDDGNEQAVARSTNGLRDRHYVI